MLVYRVCRASFKALDSEGARLNGGRWNSPGQPAVYTSSTLALAALEYLVHIEPADAPEAISPARFATRGESRLGPGLRRGATVGTGDVRRHGPPGRSAIGARAGGSGPDDPHLACPAFHVL